MRRVLKLTCLVMVCLFTLSVTAPAEASHSKTKPKRHDCSAYGKVKWTSWKNTAYIYFRNRTQSDINISYIDFGGKKRQWNRQPIKPGKAFYSMTFLTLPWIVETTKGQCLGIWEATQANRVSWVTIIKPESTGIRHACAKQTQLKFKWQWDLLRLEFTNKTSKEHSLYIVWQGKRWPAKKPYATIPPGATYKQPTYPTLPWIVVDDKDQCVGIWEADALVSRVTLKPKAGAPKPRKAEGIPLGYLHYKEQQALAGRAGNWNFYGDFVHLGVCLLSPAQRSIPPQYLNLRRYKNSQGAEHVYPMTVVGKHTGIRGNVVAVRKGGDFDCTQAEKEYGPYVSAITPGTSAKLTLVLNVLSNRYGRYVCPSCGNIDNAQTEMSAMNLFGFAAPHVKSCPGCQLREVLDFDMPEQVTNPSFTWKSSSYGYTRSAKELAVNRLAELKGFSSPLREAGDQFGNDPEYLECHQATHAHLWVNPNSHTTCGIGIVVAAVDTGDQQAHYEANANRGQNTAEEFRKKEHLAAIRALGYQPKDHEFAGGNPHRPGQFGTLPDSSYRAFADRPDDPAVKVKDSFRVHGLYVIAQDMKDHGLDLPGHPQGVGQALKDANAHFLKRSSKQHQFRLDMIPGTDEPDVSFLRLALTEKQIFTGSNSPYSGKWTDRPVWYQTIERAVNAAGFNHPRKVYVIFYDGKLDVGGVGGFHNVTINNAHKAAKLTKWHYKVHLHEIFHTLGFTKKCMPQVDKSGWHSTIQGDVLQSLGDDIDKGRVSYYDHKMKNRPGNCVLDLAKSIFLTPSTQPVAQLPPGWKLNEHCITGPKNGKVCSAMTASDYNTSGSGGRAGGASTGGGRRQGGQVNAAKAGIAEVEGSRSVTHGEPLPPP